MKENHRPSHPVLETDRPVTDAKVASNRGIQRGVLFMVVLLVGLGLSALLFPGIVGTGLAFLITAGLFLHGLSQSLLFFQSSKAVRNGWTLVNGILLLVFSWLTLLGAFMSQFGVLQMISTLSFLLGILTASIGLSQIAAGFAAGSAAPGRGWAFVSGGLNLLLSLFMCINPIVSWFALTTAWGIYLVTAAVALLFSAWSARHEAHT